MRSLYRLIPNLCEYFGKIIGSNRSLSPNTSKLCDLMPVLLVAVTSRGEPIDDQLPLLYII